MSRRLFDGGVAYSFSEPVLHYNMFMSIAAAALFVFQIPFIVNFFMSMKKGRKVQKSNHWDATTLEWSATPTPPVAHGNFETVPHVYRDPYEYSVPGSGMPFLSQDQVPSARSEEDVPEEVEV